MKRKEQKALIISGLKELVQNPESFLIVNADDYYVQFFVRDQGILMEAASEFYLEAREGTYTRKFKDAGFSSSPEENYTRYFPITNLEKIAEVSTKVLFDIYRVPQDITLELIIDN